MRRDGNERETSRAPLARQKDWRRHSTPSTSWKRSFRSRGPVKDLSRCAAARSAVLDRPARSEKEALQEVDGEIHGRLYEAVAMFRRPAAPRQCLSLKISALDTR